MKKLVLSALFFSTVFLSCSKDKDDPEPEPEVPANAITTYSDIAFGVNHGDGEYARFFSTETGKSYKDSEVNETIGPKIDIGFEQMATSVNYFLSADNKDVKLTIPGATGSLFINYVTPDVMSIAEFDAMTNSDILADITIDKNDNNSFGASNIPVLVLFKNAAGKKGVIKVTAINAERILANIKVQR